MIQQHKNICWMLLFILAVTNIGFGQNLTIDLDEAIRLAKKNYAGLERDRLSISQYQQLTKAGLPAQPTQISVSVEELAATGQSGIYAFNIQQNFNLPKAAMAQKAYYHKGAVVAEEQLALTVRELEMQVEKAYLQLLFAKQEQALVRENVKLFENFLNVASTQFETGETGKIPQLAARTRLGQAQLEEEHSNEKFQIALALFNSWLNAEQQFDIEGKLIELETNPVDSSSNNPHLQIFRAQKDMASSAIELEKSRLLPQILSGAKLQDVNGAFPAFGIQLGINVPLFKKAYNYRIQAAEVGVKVQAAALQAEQQRLNQIIRELQYRLAHQQHILKYLNEELQPIVNEQSEINQTAYREGEINYLEYLNSLEQVVLVKQQYLEALYEFNLLQVDIDYWMGR